MPTPAVPVQFLCFSVGLAFSVPVGWWSYHVGRRTAPRRVVNIDGLRSVWAQEAQVVQQPPPLPEYTQIEPGHYVRFSWRKLSRAQWKAMLETTATAQLTGAGKPFSRAELETVRDLLIARGCAYWRNPAHPAQGWELSRVMGRAIARHLGMALPHRTNGNTKTHVFSRVHARAHAEAETK